MFKKAALAEEQLEDYELHHEVTHLLNQLGKHNSHWSSWDFLKVVKCLRSYSLIEYDDQNCTYSVHPLVQHWSATTTEKPRYFMQKCILSIIGLSVSYTFSNEDYKYRCTLLKHVTNAMDSVKKNEINPLVASKIALIYDEQGYWKDAEALGVVVMEKRKQVLGDDHPDTLTSMGNLANTYRNQGHWKDAEALQVVVMEKDRKSVV